MNAAADTIRASAELVSVLDSVGPFIALGFSLMLLFLLIIAAGFVYYALDKRRWWKVRDSESHSITAHKESDHERLMPIIETQKEIANTLKEIHETTRNGLLKNHDTLLCIKSKQEQTAIINGEIRSDTAAIRSKIGVLGVSR